MPLLPPIQFHNFLGVDRKESVRVDNHTKQPGVGLRKRSEQKRKLLVCKLCSLPHTAAILFSTTTTKLDLSFDYKFLMLTAYSS